MSMANASSKQSPTFSIHGRATSAATEHRAIVEAIAACNSGAVETAAQVPIAVAQRLRLLLEEDDS